MKVRVIKYYRLCICLLCSIITVNCYSQQQTAERDETTQESPTDIEIQQMAVNTVAQMANNLINISANPHNPQHVGAQVVALLGSFVNFVTYAMRHPDILELIEDDDFKEVVRNCLEKKFKTCLIFEHDI